MILYRYEDYIEYPERVKIDLFEFKVIKETPKGYWISRGFMKNKWTSKTSVKRYAYPTKAEAMHNFIARKKRYLQILSSSTKHTKDALRQMEIMHEKEHGKECPF